MRKKSGCLIHFLPMTRKGRVSWESAIRAEIDWDCNSVFSTTWRSRTRWSASTATGPSPTGWGSPRRWPVWWTSTTTRWTDKTAPWRLRAVSVCLPPWLRLTEDICRWLHHIRRRHVLERWTGGRGWGETGVWRKWKPNFPCLGSWATTVHHHGLGDEREKNQARHWDLPGEGLENSNYCNIRDHTLS